ncbi:MAG: tetraacyldisaccharide 4'-kinase [Rickettsiales bacterium]|nr:tetraacyldisaccharide 4'-kinase [Rickettsiales bacterium]
MVTPGWFLKRNPKAYLLLPLSVVYYLVSKFVYFIRVFGQKKSKRPVICIGNIFAGGVGKTPIVMEIAERLDAPVVMRGYKRDKKSNDIGDEAKMMKKAGIKVYVGDREKNVQALNNQKDKSPIVMDDGFQNPTIKKDISILVFDEGLGFGNGFVLPAGPLREPKFAIKRADAVIIIKGKKRNPKFKIPFNVPVFYAANETVMPKAKGRAIAFAGIGYPQKFFDAIGPIAVETKAFPDHHKYTKSDLNQLFLLARKEQADLVTTEKDWVRLPADAQKKIKIAKLEIFIEPVFWTWLRNKLK